MAMLYYLHFSNVSIGIFSKGLCIGDEVVIQYSRDGVGDFDDGHQIIEEKIFHADHVVHT
jgi:hypothetical protein